MVGHSFKIFFSLSLTNFIYGNSYLTKGLLGGPKTTNNPHQLPLITSKSPNNESKKRKGFKIIKSSDTTL